MHSSVSCVDMLFHALLLFVHVLLLENRSEVEAVRIFVICGRCCLPQCLVRIKVCLSEDSSEVKHPIL